MPAPDAITPAQLLRRIGLPDAPAIVDICIDEDFALDPHLIPGAFRHSHKDPEGLIARLAGRGAVIVCQKGRKLSQGLAALLRAQGHAAEYLEGGAVGWRAMPDAPAVPFASLPAAGAAPSLWVTRHRPKIDRIACPWLIRRFVDTEARFLYVAPDEVAEVAARFEATPFDVTGVPLSHRGDLCTFDVMLDHFGLQSAPLQAMARVIRAADTGHPEAAPQAAGLLALSVGLSRQYRNDNAQLEAGLSFYDALYRWARDGQDETHDSSEKAAP